MNDLMAGGCYDWADESGIKIPQAVSYTHLDVYKRQAVTQITLDDDYNVPDYRQDIVKVIKERGELRFDEVKAMEGAAWIKGCLLYTSRCV